MASKHRQSLVQLRDAGCDMGQGFLFAKPMPAAAFAVGNDSNISQ